MICWVAHQHGDFAGVVHTPYPKVIGDILETSLQHLTCPHNELDVVYCREPCS